MAYLRTAAEPLRYIISQNGWTTKKRCRLLHHLLPTGDWTLVRYDANAENQLFLLTPLFLYSCRTRLGNIDDHFWLGVQASTSDIQRDGEGQ